MANDPDRPDLISRREAILRVSTVLGGMALIGQVAMLAGCKRAEPDVVAFSQADIALLDEIAETILPETATPGAKAAGVGPFMAMMVIDTYAEGEQKVFQDGLRAIEDECLELHGTPFMSASGSERLSLLEKLDAEQLHYMRAVDEGNGAQEKAMPHYFRMMKELALLGYFTSEIGYTQAMRYEETPGRYDPCTPYAPGDKAWAPHA
jgi:hypothetical protein